MADAPDVPAKPAKAVVQKPAAPVSLPPPLMVVAIREGTYPQIGQRIPRFRNKGDVFPLAEARHFSAWWMQKIVPGVEPVMPPEPKPVPQTTGNFAKRADPFTPTG